MELVERLKLLPESFSFPHTKDWRRMRNRLSGFTEPTGSLDKLQDSTYTSQPPEPSFMEHQVCLFGPERYEARYDYPLVVWLHSCHSSEHELESVMPELSLQNYVGCAPRGTTASDPDGRFFGWSQSAASSAIAEEVVFESIALAQKTFSISDQRIFLAGFGGGGTMAWRLALRYPKRFAGVVSICGDFPHRNQPLTNLANARALPTLWLYGAESQQCGIQQVCDTLPVLHTASLAVDIRQYPCGNELLSNMLDDVNNWLMEQVTRQPAVFETAREESFSKN